MLPLLVHGSWKLHISLRWRLNEDKANCLAELSIKNQIYSNGYMVKRPYSPIVYFLKLQSGIIKPTTDFASECMFLFAICLPQGFASSF